MFLENSSIAPFLQYTLYLLFIVIVGLSIYYLIYVGNKQINEERQLKINWKTILKLLLLTIVVTIIATLYKKYEILGNATFAVFISVLLAFLLNPLVNKLESLGLKRGVGTILTYIIILAVLVFLGIAIIPDLIKQGSNFITNLPSSVSHVLTDFNNLLEKWNIDSNITKNAQKNINSYLFGLAENIPSWITSFLNTLKGSISTIISMVLIPIITYYFIVDKDRIIKSVYNSIPKKFKSDSYYLYKEINFAMKEFIISRALMSLFIGVATGIMLWIFGIPFALVIGVITCLMDIVPYVGPVIASAPALIFALIQSPLTFIWVAVLSWVLQWIEQNVVGPKLFSNSSGIHEIVILMSIIIGGGIFGVWGMILSVPTVVIIKILIEFFIMKLKGIKPKFTGNLKKEKARAENERLKRERLQKRKQTAQKIKDHFKSDK